MKRALIILLMLSLLMCGCNNSADPGTTNETPESSSVETSEETSEETSMDTTEEEVKPVVRFRHPLTGEPLDAPFTGRATAVVVNNIQAALPHHGVSGADMIFEVETEGYITRMLAIYTDLENVGSIGPVRSARTFFNNIALSFDAPLIHCGGSWAALNGQYSDDPDTISGWEHINEQYNGSYFFRDNVRYKEQGYAWEHTLFTSGEKLLAGLEKKGYNKVYESGTDYGLTFADEIDLNGETANTVVVKFPGNKTSTMTYDVATGRYTMAQYGSPYVDGANQKAMTFRNVLVLTTSHWKIYDGTYYRSYYDLAGSGDGYYACGGEIVPIKWHRDTLRGSFTYTHADGTPLTLGVGTTYVGVVSTKCTTDYS